MPPQEATSVPPQVALLGFLALHLLDKGIAVSTQSLVSLLAALGVSEHATRTTLSRMARRGLIVRVRRGRKVYVGVAEPFVRVLRDASARVYGPAEIDWDGTWTILRVIVPETRRKQRRTLQARLQWAGFGQVDGLWVSPFDIDVQAVLGGAESVRAFRGTSLAPTETTALLREAFDLDAIARRYAAFESTWGAHPLDTENPLATQSQLNADWFAAREADPRLPVRYLPQPWPGASATTVFTRLSDALFDAASAAAAQMESIPHTPVGGSQAAAA